MFQITLIRQKRGWSQAELARKAEIGEANLSRLEQGKIFPYPGWKRKLGDALGVDPEILFQEVKHNDENPITDSN